MDSTSDLIRVDETAATGRVVFLHTPNRFYSEVQNNGVIFMPVWAYTLSSHLPEDAGYTVALHDTRMQPLEDTPAADVYLMSGINQDYEDLLAARDFLKNRHPNAKFVLGGPICWSFNMAGDLEKLAAFDHLIIGDGEDIVADIVDRLLNGQALDQKTNNAERFNLSEARPMDPKLMDATIRDYYGAVVEVSRGCPFLCEFCDIRILPDNNRPHSKSPELIVHEVDHICRLGVTNFLFACDNFIGDLRWAEEVVDALLEWRERTGMKPVFYTWLTINLYKQTDLMRKMRRAGFDTLFIGIESFNENSLLETAKVQNKAASVVTAVQEIQSFGFPVVAGLIFGFDSDDATTLDKARNGLIDSGLLSGDPSLLTALPGTPLYRRMALAGRLRDSTYGLGGHKYHTNMRYLIPKDELIDLYLDFCGYLVDGAFQYKRLESFMKLLQRGNYVPLDGGSYFSLGQAVKIIRRNPVALRLAWQRISAFLRRPRNIYFALKGWWMVSRLKDLPGRTAYLKFWFAVWSTLIVKYQDISAADFDIESIEGEAMPEHILPKGYEEDGNEPIPANKIKAQRRETMKSLQRLVDLKESA